MYYDRFGRPLTPSSPITSTTSAASARQRPAPAPRAELGLLRSYLDAHRTVWHTESLQELYPEIAAYLESRYVAARRGGMLCVRAVDGSYADLDFGHEDLRLVADVLLSREYREALFDECIDPAIERLSA